MSITLLTFLGRVPKGEKGYRTTCYDFGDGTASRPVTFFGWLLQERVAADRLVIMGTAGSMWDNIFEQDIPFEQDAEDARLKLMEAAEARAVTAELLAPLQEPLSRRLGCEARLELIPYCRDEREQVDLLAIMAKHVSPGDAVHIDITHGFRHLPMIALLAALYLEKVRKARIAGIWYGAFDPDTGDAPVHNLVGLLHIAEWIEALHTYDKDGDYGVFSPLLGQSGELLRRGAFFERTTNPVKARAALSTWVEQQDAGQDDPVAALFHDELEKRVSWYRQPDRAAWERALARRYLQQRDYLRAAIYGLEAVISSNLLRAGKDADDRWQRSKIKEGLRDSGHEAFCMLADLRNSMAHGNPSAYPRLRRILGDGQRLSETLKDLLAQLLDQQRGQGA